MPTYEPPNQNMEIAFADVRALPCHHTRLGEVSIIVLAAYAGRNKDDEVKGEALSWLGNPILGKIRITTSEDRAEGSSDVRVILHGDRWGGLTAPMQRSVIDGCLTQIEVQVKDGRTALDDNNRPKLRKRAFEFLFAGFNEVAERNGVSSLEVHNFRVLFNEHGQLYLPHFEEDSPQDFMSVAPTPKARPAKLAVVGAPAIAPSSGPVRGSLSAKLLRQRIGFIDSAATLLGIAKLEFASKPRKGVVAGLKDRVLALKFLQDFISVETGHKPSVDPDLAAAVLVTTTSADCTTDLLDRLVPECLDATVLDWCVDGERDRKGGARDEVIQVIEARLAELEKGS